jgi:sulfatase maturation enzyme AslB (radical SAM superfamily)
MKKSIDLLLNSSGDEKRIVFTGGEPTLDLKLLKYALDYIDAQKSSIKNKKIVTIVSTNGTVASEEALALLGRMDFVSVSLDGCKASHDAGRRMSDGNPSFDLVMRNLEVFRSVFPEKLAINKAITSENYKTLREDVMFLLGLGPVFLNLNVVLGDAGWDEAKSGEFIAMAEGLLKEISSDPALLSRFRPVVGDCRSGCVLSYLACAPDGGVYTCEILLMLNEDRLGEIENIRPDLLTCSYSPENPRCSGELCRQCGQICTKVSFSHGSVGPASEANVRWARDSRRFRIMFNKLTDLAAGKPAGNTGHDIIGRSLRPL